MPQSDQCFRLEARQWYGWQMLPGYVGDGFSPYFSPIHVTRIEPKKSGKGILDLHFFNAFYAEGVQDFQLSLQVLVRQNAYLVASILTTLPKGEQRTAILSPITFQWLRTYCPDLVQACPPELMPQNAQNDIQRYLAAVHIEGWRPR